MNYRHIYHAGNICDVVKHAVLALLLQQLCSKDKPVFVLDTHAGIGLYDLHDPRAQKTNEAEDGICKLLPHISAAELSGYRDVLQRLNPEWLPQEPASVDKFHFYAGSPLLIRHLLRAEDRLVACELHDEDITVLRNLFRNDKQVHIHHRDGYEALRAFLPPDEKRGLVLIDPPYEDINEFEKLVRALFEAYRRWPQGVFALWYPVKERPTIWRFHERLVASGIPKQLCAEFIYQEETRHDRLNGSGLIVINPPWQTKEKISDLFAILHRGLQMDYCNSIVQWLVPEA